MSSKPTTVDVIPKRGVDLQIRADGKTVWVNVDGLCVCRVSQIPHGCLTLYDGRKEIVLGRKAEEPHDAK